MSERQLIDFGRDILSRQPFSMGLGTEITEMREGFVEMRLSIHEGLTQHLRMVHGGVIASMADMAIGFAGGPVLQEAAVTQEFKINYLRPGVGEALIGRGTVVASGKSQAVVRADVYVLADGEEKLCAVAQGTMVRAAR